MGVLSKLFKVLRKQRMRKMHENEIAASQALKIITESADIVNTTKNPDVFFPRYKLMQEKVELLCGLSGVKYKGTPPILLKLQLERKKQAAIRNMIERYYNDADARAKKLKTLSGKMGKYTSFISTLEDYYEYMDQENIDYINELYDNAISELTIYSSYSKP